MILILIAAISIPFLPALSLVRDGEAGYAEDDSFRISFSGHQLYMADEHIEFGQIDRAGLVRTIADPYSAPMTLRPQAKPYAYSGKHSGAVLKLGPLAAGTSLSDRPFAFAYSDFGYMEAAMLFAFSGSESDRIIGDPFRNEEGNVLYAAVGGGYSIFSAMGIFSFSDTKGISLYGALGAEYEDYSIYVMAGDPISLYSGRDSRLFGIRGSIGEEGFRSEFELTYGAIPVFSNNFMPRTAELRTELWIGNARLYSAMRYSFTRTGRTYKSDYAAISFDGLRIGYSSSGGIVASYSHDLFEIGIENRSYYIEVKLGFIADNADITIRLTSDGHIRTAVSMVL